MPSAVERRRADLEAWPPQRQELLNWFRRSAPALAGAYEGAVRLLEDEDFPGRIHFIAHAVRDIADRLVFVLDPQLQPRRVQYENELDGIEGLWPNIQDIRNRDGGETREDAVTLSYRLAERIDSLVAAHRERRARPSNHDLLFRHLMRQEPSAGALNRRVAEDFKGIREYFMRWTHLRQEMHEPDESELKGKFSSFEAMLHSFVGGFFTGTVELDAILQQANE